LHPFMSLFQFLFVGRQRRDVFAFCHQPLSCVCLARLGL
jgi:hypothetical protein